MIQQRSYTAKAKEIKRDWHLVDAKEVPVGRLATRVASLLRGKHKPTYTPHMDTGDFVVVVNASSVKFTGKKLQDKNYYRHSGYLGSIKGVHAASVNAKKPEAIIYSAVKGMLPKGPLGRQMLRKLKVYAGEEHPHRAQQPGG